jgi:hypothetical protein
MNFLLHPNGTLLVYFFAVDGSREGRRLVPLYPCQSTRATF